MIEIQILHLNPLFLFSISGIGFSWSDLGRDFQSIGNYMIFLKSEISEIAAYMTKAFSFSLLWWPVLYGAHSLRVFFLLAQSCT